MTSAGLYAFILAPGYVQAMSNRRKVRVGPVNFYALPFLARDHSSRAQAIRAMNSKFDGLLLRPFLPAGKSRSHCSAGPLDRAEEIGSLGQAEGILKTMEELEQVSEVRIRGMDLSTGAVDCEIRFPEKLFYEVLTERTGVQVTGDGALMKLLTELTAVKQEYDRIADALSAVRATGYGVVLPQREEVALEKPQTIRRGGAFGIKMKAAAPSIHMIRVDIDTEISPMVGDESQSKELQAQLSGQEPEQIWESNIFGKTVYEMIRDGLNTKLVGLPQEVRTKFRGTLTKVVNEGATGLICLIL